MEHLYHPRRNKQSLKILQRFHSTLMNLKTNHYFPFIQLFYLWGKLSSVSRPVTICNVQPMPRPYHLHHHHRNVLGKKTWMNPDKLSVICRWKESHMSVDVRHVTLCLMLSHRNDIITIYWKKTREEDENGGNRRKIR